MNPVILSVVHLRQNPSDSTVTLLFFYCFAFRPWRWSQYFPRNLWNLWRTWRRLSTLWTSEFVGTLLHWDWGKGKQAKTVNFFLTICVFIYKVARFQILCKAQLSVSLVLLCSESSTCLEQPRQLSLGSYRCKAVASLWPIQSRIAVASVAQQLHLARRIIEPLGTSRNSEQVSCGDLM
jgi:hypothetical protein